MTRIQDTFATLRRQGRAGLIPYLTAGDPDLTVTRDCLRALAEAGADLIELGVPFSDPMADGPVLQRSAQRALAAGTTLRRVLELVAEIRREIAQPIVLFGYYNPIFRYGTEAFARDAAAAGVDGVLCVDLPPEESTELRTALRAHDLDLVLLLAPTTPDPRVRRICRLASGFLYFVSVLGVTGAREHLPAELPELVGRVRAVTELPIGVGFGVQTPEQAAWVAGFADAVVVGSAIAKVLETSPPAEAAARVGEFAAALVAAMRAADR
jgi:tryptophan synthase alpha chain